MKKKKQRKKKKEAVIDHHISLVALPCFSGLSLLSLPLPLVCPFPPVSSVPLESRPSHAPTHDYKIPTHTPKKSQAHYNT
jgi:hypothetical protein